MWVEKMVYGNVVASSIESVKVLLYDRCLGQGDKRRAATVTGLTRIVQPGILEFPSFRGLSGADQKKEFEDLLVEGAPEYGAVVINAQSVQATELLELAVEGYRELRRPFSCLVYLGERQS